ncbi:permease [Natrarchaeobius halalkaliphilus]|uniref:Permease n=1 Tax=Natrarchaeobius halalkaliphilus TaxID=1679091 RepID=A0A3N6M1Z1_9EURY|nr:permease [Natrarchaeobius halalkaliphilus]RQG89810.1 permease [Natrarchaeobius halalkaliphilus]
MPAESLESGYLFDLYRRYIGEPEDRTDVYLGFGLFLGGIGLAIVALVLFLWSSTLDAQSPAYSWAEPAYALVMISLPVTMLGIVVLLPAERRVLYTSVVGVGVTLAATAGFVYAYPEDWYFHGADYTVEVIATYAVGLAAISASTGAALIAHYLDMARAAERVDHEDSPGESEAKSYSDEEIQADIDEAMEDVELSWGGVEKNEQTRLSFSEDTFDDVDVDGQAKTTRSSGVDAQVAGLKGLKGGETTTTTSSSTVDDQTEKLRQLREQQRTEDAVDGDTDRWASVRTLLDRIRSVLGRN